MDSLSAEKVLVDNTNIPKYLEQPVKGRRRLNENDSFAKLSETTITTTSKTSEEIDGTDTTTEYESTLTRV